MVHEELKRLVSRARSAQPAWGRLEPGERARRIAPLHDRVLERADAIADCLREELGKPPVEALLGEVLPSADVVKYWTGVIEDLMRPSVVELDPIAFPRKHGTT